MIISSVRFSSFFFSVCQKQPADVKPALGHSLSAVMGPAGLTAASQASFQGLKYMWWAEGSHTHWRKALTLHKRLDCIFSLIIL